MWCVQVVVERSKVTWPGARIAKKNEGMPNYENNNVRGTLFITFDVNFPKGELTAEDKAGEREREINEKCLWTVSGKILQQNYKQ